MAEEIKNVEQSEETQIAESGAIKNELNQEPKIITRTQQEDNELFRREAGKAKKSVYSQLGVKDETEFSALLTKLNTIKKAEEEAEIAKPEIERLKGELSALSKVNDDNKTLYERISKYELDEIIRNKGVTDSKEAKLATYEIRELIASGKDKNEAAEEYFAANPINKDPVPLMSYSAGKTPISTATSKEEFNKLTYAQKLAFKEKNPERFKEFFR